LLLRRFINLLKVISGYAFSRLTRHVFHWGYPLAASIEPTNRCNLQCPECPSGQSELTRPRGFMEPALYHSVIDQLSPFISYLTLYFQGEPYLNSRFFDYIAYARSKKIYVSSSTNGHYLSHESAAKTVKSGLNRLIISLDGTDQETYEKYRAGGSFEKVIAGITALVEAKKELNVNRPYLVIQFLVLKTNQHQLSEVKMLGKKLGVDKIEFKSAQFNSYLNGNPLIPDLEKYSRYKKIVDDSGSGVRYIFKNPLPRHCFRMWSSCVITWDAKVVPCCYDKDARHIFGDMTEDTIRKIWKSKMTNSFRQQILDEREKIDICQNCLEGIYEPFGTRKRL